MIVTHWLIAHGKAVPQDSFAPALLDEKGRQICDALVIGLRGGAASVNRAAMKFGTLQEIALGPPASGPNRIALQAIMARSLDSVFTVSVAGKPLAVAMLIPLGMSSAAIESAVAALLLLSGAPDLPPNWKETAAGVHAIRPALVTAVLDATLAEDALADLIGFTRHFATSLAQSPADRSKPKRCPRCQASEKENRSIHQCDSCAAYCCDQCMWEALEREYRSVPWGVKPGCPECKKPVRFVCSLSPPTPALVVPRLAPEEMRQRDEESKRRAEEEFVQGGNSTSVRLTPAQMHLLPRIIAARGARISWIHLTGATDDVLKLLGASAAQLPELIVVEMEHSTTVTDEGYKALAAFKKLMRVTFYHGNDVTIHGTDMVRKALPKCELTGVPIRPWWRFW